MVKAKSKAKPAKRKPAKRKQVKARRPTRGRPEFVPTEAQRKQIQTLAGYKIPQDEMCLHIINPETGRPIAEQTLRTVFADDIAFGYANARLRLMAATYRNALGEVSVTKDANGNVTETVVVPGNVTAQIWCGKTQFQMREYEGSPPNTTPPDPAQAAAAGVPDEEQSAIAAARDVAFAMAIGKQLLLAKKPNT